MNHAQLIKAIAAHLPALSAREVPTAAAIDAVLQALASWVLAELVTQPEARVPGLGKFDLVSSKAHAGRNLRTGEPMTVPAGLRLRFTAQKSVRDKLAERAKPSAEQAGAAV